MNKNLINSAIPEKTLTQVEDALKAMNTQLAPYLVVKMNNETLDSMAKLGDKSLSFVENAIEYAKRDASLVPNHANTSEAELDLAFFKSMNGIELAIQQLATLISQTRALAGAEALDFANDYYKNVKYHSTSGNNKAEPIYLALNERYKNVGRPSSTKSINPPKTN